jgi:hypothetical protein
MYNEKEVAEDWWECFLMPHCATIEAQGKSTEAGKGGGSVRFTSRIFQLRLTSSEIDTKVTPEDPSNKKHCAKN